jgi:hypothetical protein
LTDISEFGDLMLFGSPAILDEWGFRKIDGVLEDGTKIIVAEAPPPPPIAGILVQVM